MGNSPRRCLPPDKTLLFEGRLGFIMVGKKSHMVVIDGQEGKKYDGIVAPPEGEGIIFDSPDQVHYIARKSNAFYLVEERMTWRVLYPAGLLVQWFLLYQYASGSLALLHYVGAVG